MLQVLRCILRLSKEGGKRALPTYRPERVLETCGFDDRAVNLPEGSPWAEYAGRHPDLLAANRVLLYFAKGQGEGVRLAGFTW